MMNLRISYVQTAKIMLDFNQ